MKENKSSTNKAALIAGELFIIGTIAGILSYVVTGPVLGSPDYLARIAADPNPIAFGALFVLIMGFALAMVPVVIFPVVKKYNEVLGLGYVVFRGALESVTYLGTAFSWLLLIPISKDLLIVGASGGSQVQTLGKLVMEAASISATLCAIVFPLGAIMFYIVLYQGRLIPRWLSVWGLVAVILHLLATGLAGMFSITSSMSTIQSILSFPIFLQEMVMAVWMIVKGFNTTAITPEETGKEFGKA
jgi:hypothetical protein